MFDERFIRVDTNLLCELTSAADALDMRPLVDLASRAIAKMIEGGSILECLAYGWSKWDVKGASGMRREQVACICVSLICGRPAS